MIIIRVSAPFCRVSEIAFAAGGITTRRNEYWRGFFFLRHILRSLGSEDTRSVFVVSHFRLEAFLQRLCSLLYMGPLHPSSAHVAHLLQDFLGTSPRVETLRRLQSSRPERELRQALQVRFPDGSC